MSLLGEDGAGGKTVFRLRFRAPSKAKAPPRKDLTSIADPRTRLRCENAGRARAGEAQLKRIEELDPSFIHGLIQRNPCEAQAETQARLHEAAATQAEMLSNLTLTNRSKREAKARLHVPPPPCPTPRNLTLNERSGAASRGAQRAAASSHRGQR